jgi:signal transduction histidine kinase
MGLREARASVRALRPHAENPLAVALPALISRMTSGTGVSGNFSVKGNPRRLPADFEEHLLRIGQEALTNSLRHAQATRFDVRVEFTADRVELELSDDGCGFCIQERQEGFGLVGMRERIDFLRGRLNLESSPGAGTRILISVPTTAD